MQILHDYFLTELNWYNFVMILDISESINEMEDIW
jgi:hypothetical protein